MNRIKSAFLGLGLTALMAIPGHSQIGGDYPLVFSENYLKSYNPSHEDLLRFSQYNYSFGTARSASMGGAFSSLGGEMTSAVLNPAGLGMYRRSEVTFTPSFTMNKAETTNKEGGSTFDSSGRRNRFGINNFGFAYNLYTGLGPLTSVTFGFNYTKLADFNTRTNVDARNSASMLDFMVRGMNHSGIVPPSNGNPINVRPNNEGFWDGVLAYNTGLIDYDADAGVYYREDALSQGAKVNSHFDHLTKGRIGQYDLAMGFNFSNIFYIGMGFGMQEIDYRETLNYTENASGNSGRLMNYNYRASREQDGYAWNFKIGAILRPVEDLRFSVAFHTQSYIEVDEIYSKDIYSNLTDGYYTDGASMGGISYHIKTPQRFMAGLSYTLDLGDGPLGLISLDYELASYGNMRLGWRNFDDTDYQIKNDVKSYYTDANNFRIGIEAILTPDVFLRAGYAYYGSMYKDIKVNNGKSLKDYGMTSNYSFGFGYRVGSFGLDFAYVFMDNKAAPRYIYADQENNTVYTSGLYQVDNNRHNMMVTGSFRF